MNLAVYLQVWLSSPHCCGLRPTALAPRTHPRQSDGILTLAMGIPVYEWRFSTASTKHVLLLFLPSRPCTNVLYCPQDRVPMCYNALRTVHWRIDYM